MRLLLRCDALSSLGVGHLGRCLAVAAAARDAGWEVALVGRFETAWAVERVAAADLTVLGLGATPGEIARIAANARAGVVHVDHYGLPATDEMLAACHSAGAILSNVADFAFGARPADVTTNPNFGARSSVDRVHAGPAYALLRPDVLAARAARTRRAESVPTRGVVVMGGTDPFGATEAVVRALADVARRPLVLEVLTPAARELTRVLGTRQGAVELRFGAPTADLPRMLAQADVAVTAAGTTLLETACIGVPTAALCVTDNQRVGYEAAVEAGVVVGLGDLVAGPDAWRSGLERLLTDPSVRVAGTRLGRDLVDGRGAARLIEDIAATTSEEDLTWGM